MCVCIGICAFRLDVSGNCDCVKRFNGNSASFVLFFVFAFLSDSLSFTLCLGVLERK